MTQPKPLTINDAMDLSYKLAENRKKQIELTTELSEKIKRNPSTIKVSYENCTEAFDYVAHIFPDIGVETIDVRQATPLLLKKVGYDGIGGFFERISKTVIVASYLLPPVTSNKYSIKAKLKKDEVIVHELLHYCHNEIGSNPSVNMKEEFAYGWSLGYLRKKGYTDAEVIQHNYMPYLYNVCYKDGFLNVVKNSSLTLEKLRQSSPFLRNKLLSPLKNKIHKEIIRLATEKGEEIIRIYSEKIADKQTYKNMRKSQNKLFDVLDLD